MFHVYENNEYQRPQKFPSFITTDSMLHTYHVFYDYTLRRWSPCKLYDAAVELTDAMLAASRKTMQRRRMRMSSRRRKGNVAYFAVASDLLDRQARSVLCEDEAGSTWR